MERNKSPKSAATRARILSTATELFRRQGFEKTTMREIARVAGVALGAAYYYFPTKESMVQALYEGLSSAVETEMPRILAHKSLEKRLHAFTERLFEVLAPERALYAVIAPSSFDPRSPLSPLHAASAKPRAEAIDRFRRIVAADETKVPPALRPTLPRLLWLWHLALLAVWVYDTSPGQKKTRALRDATLRLVTKGMGLLAFRPFAREIEPLLAFVDDLLAEDP